jgi:NAD(P)-dependent dehydrogenase (short-subunit alcohol dehydrogenase family)/ketosteroid isomerase-like protein
VSGAGSIGPGWGNGKAAAVLFAREGARVLAADINIEAARETKGLIEAEGGVCEAVSGNAAVAADVAAITDVCLSAFGRIDVLHNNVGIVEVGGPVETTEESWDRVNDVNLKSMFLTCKHVLPHMERQGRGAIVNIASIAGIRWLGVPYVSYAATKAAVIQFTRVVALQYARCGIRANSILPGLMNTPMVHAPEVVRPMAGIPKSWCGAATSNARRGIWATPGMWPTRRCSLPPTRPSISPAPNSSSMAGSPPNASDHLRRKTMADNRQKIIDLDKQRMTAMAQKDIAKLNALLSDDLIYTHSSARLDTKQSLIGNMESGSTVYTAVEPSDVKAQEFGDTVVLTGSCRISVMAQGRPNSFSVRFTDVYANKGGQWQMVAWQSTRLPD